MRDSAVLVVDRRARCAVELTAQPSPTEQTAGEELARYLGKLGGIPIALHREDKIEAPVRILVGSRVRADERCRDLPVDALRNDGFLLHVAPDLIALIGANDRGTLYAAYELIERLGVRWYWPGPENEFVPAAGGLTLPTGTEVVNPSFRFRLLRAVFKGMMGLDMDPRTLWQTFPSPLKEKLLDWGVKNRLNTALMESAKDRDTVAFLARRGGVAGLDSVHAWGHMVSSDVYYDAHPEYFAVDEKGVRVRTDPEHNHLCTSNSEVIDLVVQAALNTMEQNPEAAFVSITQSDGGGYCQCPECLAKCGPGTLVRSGREYIVRTNNIIDYANRVAERFCKKWPDRYVYVLAYNLTVPPPSIPVHPNVMVQLAHYRANRPLSDASGERRVLHEVVDGWAATGAPLSFYTYNPSSGFAQAPYPAARKFHDDMKWLRAHGFVGFHSQSEGTLWGFYGLNHLSMARSLWDVDLDFDALQRDYFRSLFGGAAEPVQAMHEVFERALMEREPMSMQVVELGSFLSPEVLARAHRLLQEAREAETSDAVQARLGILAAQVAYGDRLMAARRTAEVYERTKDPAILKQLRRERDAVLSYIETHPVEGAYYLAGIRYGIDLYLVGNRRLLRNLD